VIFRIIKTEFQEPAAIMRKRKNVKKTANNPLDRFSGKRGRGRPVTVVPSAVRGRADNWRVSLARFWSDLEAPLLAAQTADDVATAFEKALPGNNEFPPHAQLFFRVLKDPKFPKRKKARINFLADSTAGVGLVTPRRSRDICTEERAVDAERHQILRYEYWIECSCGYQGVSQGHSCKECGAEIPFPILGSGMF
jgi:hypothetical protein